MTITLKLLATGAIVILMQASYAKAGQLLVRGPGGYAHASLKQRYAATRFHVRQSPDLGGASRRIGGGSPAVNSSRNRSTHGEAATRSAHAKVDVIVTVGGAVPAAKQATSGGVREKVGTK